MLRSDLEITTWAKINDSCSISAEVEGGDLVVRFAGQLDNFEVLFTPASLDQLIAAATEGRALLSA
ncbi:hypothetical protein [Actinokineospora globicatena]|uniref:Uncharacterized protein n=1 Tax=Actinokineospora globicatena TaxID=103729 RepID=A0A9W6QPU1_9PSEU|nr:hypothetical protein [Actinokineospora globicatena]MCP2305050.1 hypothetical protein [Actinokineospora globicatena]GLW80515.1 hypothetical protein Aglo01_49960 [Actinokineospora globicatena]GLW87343.1 hypothetical protein Aglo02_49820 [Actinokineospora globicatena]GLW93941.1 hypothetical protein Aglo03_47570 [Actinokineospora globicatena]